MPVAPNSGNQPKEFSFRSRQAHWEQLKSQPNQTLDIVIIGGGIVGAGLLRELSLRGAKNIFLFEKNDFASGTSSVSSKLIHAGIRYLEQVWDHLKHLRIHQAWSNLVFVVEASRERKILGRMAPLLIQPKPIYFTLSKADPRSSLSILTGVWLYTLIQALQGQFFGLPKIFFNQKKISEFLPEIDATKVKSVFTFWDSETDDARLVIENLQSSNRMGGVALNYVELVEYTRGNDEILLKIKNKESGEVIQVKTKRMINASGAFVDELRTRQKNASQPTEKLIDRVAGSHMDIYPAIADKSYYVSAPGNRFVFLLRRNEDGLVYTRVGTTERPMGEGESSEQVKPSQNEIGYLSGLVKDFFPDANLNGATVVKTDAGIRPLRSQAGLVTFNKSREHDIVEEGPIWHVIGVKLTDFRRVACEIADKLSIPSKGIEPLRPLNASKIYLEATMQEIVDQTMAIHWEDYVYRRAGLKPILQSTRESEVFEKQFEEFSKLIGKKNP